MDSQDASIQKKVPNHTRNSPHLAPGNGRIVPPHGQLAERDRPLIAVFCDWLAATRVSQRFQDLDWFVPLVQTIHILSIAVVMTSVGFIACKLLGLSGRRRSLAALMGGTMPWVWSALALLLITGALLTITEPARELLNLLFRIKMLMVLAMAAILLLLQERLTRDPDYWTASAGRRGSARALGSAALLLAVCIIIAGRWIAYT